MSTKLDPNQRAAGMAAVEVLGVAAGGVAGEDGTDILIRSHGSAQGIKKPWVRCCDCPVIKGHLHDWKDQVLESQTPPLAQPACELKARLMRCRDCGSHRP